MLEILKLLKKIKNFICGTNKKINFVKLRLATFLQKINNPMKQICRY